MPGRKTKYSLFFLIGALVLLVLGPASYAEELRILIKETATVTGDTVKLGDIAVFTPKGDARIPMLREEAISAAPAPGRDLSLNSRFLIYRLSGLMSGDHHVRIKVPQMLLVHRNGQMVSAKKMTDLFKQYVFSRAPWDRKEMKLESVRTPGPVLLPCGHLSWDIQGRGEEDFVGDVSLVISFSVDGRLYRKVPVSGRILVSRKVVKTVRKIRKGEMIVAGDVVELYEDTMRSGGTEVRSRKAVVGKRAARTLQEGQVLSREMVEDPPTVRKGDRVIIRAENGAVAVSALGKVLEDGRSGEQVKVVNISSGKELFADVICPGQVRVTF